MEGHRPLTAPASPPRKTMTEATASPHSQDPQPADLPTGEAPSVENPPAEIQPRTSRRRLQRRRKLHDGTPGTTAPSARSTSRPRPTPSRASGTRSRSTSLSPTSWARSSTIPRLTCESTAQRKMTNLPANTPPHSYSRWLAHSWTSTSPASAPPLTSLSTRRARTFSSSSGSI